MSIWKKVGEHPMPENGVFLVANKKYEVCYADSRDGTRTIHNVVGFADWTYGEPVTHWMTMPFAPPQ